MLGLAQTVEEEYVVTGQVKAVFWPVINHGDPSLYATMAAECVGQQDPTRFWQMHRALFERQSELWRATRDFFVQQATALGAEQVAFEACYDDPTTLEHVLALDAMRRERGIYSQPIFDVNGQYSAGSSQLLTLIRAALRQTP